jgi:DNA modification methylase
MSKGFFKKVQTSVFETAKEKYGIFPTTTWDINYSDKLTQELKEKIGDGVSESSFTREGAWNSGGGLKNKYWNKKDTFTRKNSGTLGYKSARKDCFSKQTDDESCYRGKITESIFSPQIAQYVFSMFAPKKGLCFDPFGGGGTRAIIASINGLDYKGVEIRQDEVNAINERLKYNDINNAEIICADSQNCNMIMSDSADFSITCPPYYNMEMYKGGENDLSMKDTYEKFLEGIFKVAKETYRIMKDNTLVTIVIGLHRSKNKELFPMHHDFATIYRKVGFKFKEEIILCHKNNGALQRVGNFQKGSNLLIRTHEYLLLFKKGEI